MDYLELLNYVNSETIKIFYMSIVIIIIKYLLKLSGDKKALETFDLIFQRFAEGIMIASIILLISIYALFYSEISLFIINVASLLALGILYVENRMDRSPLMKEIDNILNNLRMMNNLIKTIIKLFIDIMPRILSIIILFSIISLIIFPTNELLIDIILNLSLFSLMIILTDIVISGTYVLIAGTFRSITNKTDIDIEKWIK